MIKEVVSDMGNTMVFMSGPPPMVETYEKMCDALGMPEENVRKDIFLGY
jgi:ferredoxin-NADP reductase